jgi:hyaluronate lyase
MLRECFKYVEKGDGFYKDGSFIQHTVYAYIGGYGSALINAFSRISYSLEYTCFRLDSEMIESQFNWIYFNFIPFLYKGAFFDLVRGRGVSSSAKGESTGLATINSFFFALKYIQKEKSLNYLKKYLKDLYLNNKNFYDSSLSVGVLGILDELMLEDIPLVNINYNFARVYPKTDKAIAQVNGVGIGISLSSTRQGKYESINQENMKGWYQGDGMTYVYISPNDYASLFYHNANPYRLPGTTVTTAPREPSSLSGQKALAKFDFVGGTFNEQSMVAAMALNGSSPGANFTSSLIGYKAYFFSENILVCTGVNISCNDNYNVETIIENRKINGKFYFGDKEITDKSGKITSSYIYIENYGGIYIPDYKNARFNLTDKGFLEIYLEHGKKIKNHSYKYYILPKIEKSNFENLVKDVEIVYNNDKLSVVVFKSKKIVELVFWQKGNFNNLVVDNPCTILINNKPELYITDPTQKIGKINVSLEEKTKTANLKDGDPVRLFSSNNDIKSSWLENIFKHNK